MLSKLISLRILHTIAQKLTLHLKMIASNNKETLLFIQGKVCYRNLNHMLFYQKKTIKSIDNLYDHKVKINQPLHTVIQALKYKLSYQPFRLQ